MFKLGNRVIYQPNIGTAIAEAKKYGFEVLEIHLSSPQFMPSRYTSKQLISLKELAIRQKITLHTHAPLEQSMIFTGPEFRQAAKDQLRSMIKFSRALGARCLTLHPGKAAVFHTANGKILNDELYPNFYAGLFEESIKDVISLAPKDLHICVENTDNFIPKYQRILDKYLPTGKIFLTWDIRKNFDYVTNEFVEEKWNFVRKNREYVKNIHISGLGSGHGSVAGWEHILERFFKLFDGRNLPMIIEVLPLRSAVASKKIIEKLIKNGF